MTIWMIKPIFGKHKWKNEKKKDFRNVQPQENVAQIEHNQD